MLWKKTCSDKVYTNMYRFGICASKYHRAEHTKLENLQTRLSNFAVEQAKAKSGLSEFSQKPWKSVGGGIAIHGKQLECMGIHANPCEDLGIQENQSELVGCSKDVILYWNVFHGAPEACNLCSATPECFRASRSC